MHRRIDNVLTTPVLLTAWIKNALMPSASVWKSVRFLSLLLVGMVILFLLCLNALWHVTAPHRALASFNAGDFNRSAEIFASYDGAAARYNAANAWYRAGEYEHALQLYSALEPADPPAAARIWFNRGDTLVRLKEYAKAREAFARSLALHFDNEALENMMHILDAEEQDHMLTGRQEGKKRAQEQEESASEQAQRKRKEGGGSEQQSQAERSRDAGGEGKKAARDPQLDFSDKGGSRLSSKQYELINQRSVHETKPW